MLLGRRALALGSASGLFMAMASAATTSRSAAAVADGARPAQPQGPINFRDLGDVHPTMKKHRVYRSSQIYKPDVLKDLGIVTVVDLRGKTEAQRAEKRARSTGTTVAPSADTPQTKDTARRSPSPAPVAEPPRDQPTSTSGYETDSSMDERPRQTGEPGVLEAPIGAPADDFATALGAQGNEPAMDSTRMFFDVLPSKQFALTMFQMPGSVWRNAVGNLLHGKDPRRPFVKAFSDENLLGFFKYYVIMLEHSKPNIAAVLRNFTHKEKLPALVHCAHGKDRTGVLTALLLAACGVPDEEIVKDYAQSEIELKKYRSSLGLDADTAPLAPLTRTLIPLDDSIVASSEGTMRAVLDYIREKYQTPEGYLKSLGLTHEELNAIRHNLMKKDAADALEEQEQQQMRLLAQQPTGHQHGHKQGHNAAAGVWTR